MEWKLLLSPAIDTANLGSGPRLLGAPVISKKNRDKKFKFVMQAVARLCCQVLRVPGINWLLRSWGPIYKES